MENKERELLKQLRDARTKKKSLEESLDQTKRELEEIETRLLEILESKSAIATAKYDGLGYARIEKPRLYASCSAENMDRLFEILKADKRDDLIKTTVLPSQLASYISEKIDTGQSIPDCVSYYLKSKIKIYD